MDGLRWLVLIVSAIWLHSIPAISARGCGSRLQLRSATDPGQQIDLSRLSAKQLQKLAQQLAALQAKDEEEDQDEEEMEEPALADLEREEYEEDHRGSSRPWNRVQRIIRRQLVKIPKRYLKKILRQFGLARSVGGVRSADVVPLPELEEYYLVPLE